MLFTAAADIVMIVTLTLLLLAMMTPAIAAPPLRPDWMCWSPGIGTRPMLSMWRASTRGATTTRLLRRHGGGGAWCC